MPKLPRETSAPHGSPTGQTPRTDDAADLSSLFNYPALGSLFETPNGPALADMRARLKRTHQNTERVVRHGTKQEAERATRVALALKTMLQLLDELEARQRGTGAK